MNGKFITDLESLKRRCENFSDTINALEILNLNLPSPEPAEITQSDSEWRIFVTDAEEFLKNYPIDDANNIRRLLYSESINERVIEDLKVCLHRAGLQAKNAEFAGGLILRWENKDGKSALARVEISADGKSRRFVLDFNSSNSITDEFWEDFLSILKKSKSPELRELYNEIITSNRKA